MRRVVIAHGGTASKVDEKDGTERAVEAGMRALKKDGALEAAVAACSILEDDERFNAGTGSNFCFDGRTIEMDAAVMTSENEYGAVSAIERVKNPVRVARALIGEPDCHLTGTGATAFARAIGFEEFDVSTPKAKEKWEEAIDKILAGEASETDNPWKLDTLREFWNYERPFDEVFGRRPGEAARGAAQGATLPHDTVGAVAFDGHSFAAAASTGGTITTLRGRVGDTPTIGAGLFAGECGAIACSGHGNILLRERTATKIHQWMTEGASATAALRRFVAPLPHKTDFFGIAIGREDFAGIGNREIAWSVAED